MFLTLLSRSPGTKTHITPAASGQLFKHDWHFTESLVIRVYTILKINLVMFVSITYKLSCITYWHFSCKVVTSVLMQSLTFDARSRVWEVVVVVLKHVVWLLIVTREVFVASSYKTLIITHSYT